MTYLLDTHVLLWRLLDPKRLPKAARALLADEANDFLIPTIVLLEIQYLIEIGRIAAEIDAIVAVIQEDPRLSLAAYDETIMLHSLRLTTTRDPFDRIILAHALATSIRILTKDRWMRKTAAHLVIA